MAGIGKDSMQSAYASTAARQSASRPDLNGPRGTKSRRKFDFGAVKNRK
jgi:hypothetical protein